MSKRKQPLSVDEWREIGKQLRQSRDLLSAVVKRVQTTTDIKVADKINRERNRIETLSIKLENVAAEQHPDWRGVIDGLAGREEYSPERTTAR